MSSTKRAAASLSKRASDVSSISDEVNPMWMYRESSPTYSPTDVRKAITSCLTVFSISSTLATSKRAFSLMFFKAFSGITPLAASASQTRISISSQRLYLSSALHRLAIFGLEYRGIMPTSPLK